MGHDNARSSSGAAWTEMPRSSQPEGTSLRHFRPEQKSIVSELPAVILYDGDCNLCASVVAFILPRDRRRRFRFAALQSDSGRRLLRAMDCTFSENSTVVLVEGERCRARSDAALRICSLLPLPWPALAGLGLVPRPLRDLAYKFIAGQRRRWFGRRSTCLLSVPGWEDRFLD
jgi:predicted DCC family thiol-disulfide oxidoreductase YuxK